MNDSILVSIICNTYNHEKYVRKALDSFVNQKTNFKYEILIYDDASTDNTPRIIKEYQEKYPELINPVFMSVNQYSKDTNVPFYDNIKRATGKYIAICEGDDFWDDSFKLQKQVDALNSNLDVNICAHGAFKIIDNKRRGYISPSKANVVFSVEDVIKGGGGFVATNSLLCRNSIFQNPPKFFTYFSFDYALQIWGSLKGGMLYIPDIMSSYRVMAQGSWSVRMKNNQSARLEHLNRTLKMFDLLNEETSSKYISVINFRRIHIKAYILDARKEYWKILSDKEISKVLTLKEKIKYLIKLLLKH